MIWRLSQGIAATAIFVFAMYEIKQFVMYAVDDNRVFALGALFGLLLSNAIWYLAWRFGYLSE